MVGSPGSLMAPGRQIEDPNARDAKTDNVDAGKQVEREKRCHEKGNPENPIPGSPRRSC